MRVILNLIPVKSGGGQMQALNLLSFLAENGKNQSDWLILVGEDSYLHKWMLEKSSLKFLTFKSVYLSRFFLDYFFIRWVIKSFKPDVIFHFTVPWRKIAVPQVVRTVYSNLYFPEVQFWSKRPILTYLRKLTIDRLRLAGTLRADGLMFENRAMLDRALTLFRFPPDRAAYIRPSRVLYSECREYVSDSSAKSTAFQVLYLSSWYENKNISILPFVAMRLRDLGVDVRFVLTLDPQNPEVNQHIIRKSLALGVYECFELIGTVHPTNVPSVIQGVDSMILLSELECFSSNLVEAWSFGKPLIISNREWARSECGEAALYVEPKNSEEIAGAIAGLVSSDSLCFELIERGYRVLEHFSTPEEKARQQIAFLEYICSAGKKS